MTFSHLQFTRDPSEHIALSSKSLATGRRFYIS